MSTTAWNLCKQQLVPQKELRGPCMNDSMHPMVKAAHERYHASHDIGGHGDQLVQQLQPFYPPLDAEEKHDASNSTTFTPEKKGKFIEIPTRYETAGQITTTTFSAYVFEQLKQKEVQDCGGLFKIRNLTKVSQKRTQSLYSAFHKLKKTKMVEARGAKILRKTDGCILLQEKIYKNELQSFVTSSDRPQTRFRKQSELGHKDLREYYEKFVDGLAEVKSCKSNKKSIFIKDKDFTLYRATDGFQMNELADHGPLRFIPAKHRFVIVH